MAGGETFREAVSAFGALTKAKLGNIAISGAPEDQLRAPLESLMRDLAALAGFQTGAVEMDGESTLVHPNTRPDYAVVVARAGLSVAAGPRSPGC